MRNYKNENIFNYLTDVEKLRDKLKKQNPTFKFSSDKGDVAEAYVKSVFGLKQAPYGQEGYDLISKNGTKVSVKNVWEYNPYRGLALSGGSNVKSNAYKQSDHLICTGRDKDNNIRILANLPIKFIEKYIKGGIINPRVEIRNIVKVNSLIPKKFKLKPVKKIFPDFEPQYYPKDLREFFDLPKGFWGNCTMTWRNYKNKVHGNVRLNDFRINRPRYYRTMLLTEWDVALFYLISKNINKGIDYKVATYMAFHKLINKDFPNITPVTRSVIISYMSETGYTTIKKRGKYSKYLSNFMTGAYIKDKKTYSYLTDNDLKILKYFKKLKKEVKRGDQPSWHKAFLKACKQYPKPKDIKLINPKKFNFKKVKIDLPKLTFEDCYLSKL